MAIPTFRVLRGLGPLGNLAANGLAFLTANWGTAVSVAAGTGVALWASAIRFFHEPAVQTGGEIFLATLWTIVAVLYIFDRTKPRIVRAAPDYRYGLTFEGIIPTPDPLNEVEWLGFALQIRNFSQAPIRYEVTEFDLRIGSRALPKPSKLLVGYLARGSGKAISPSKFSKEEVREFFGRRVKGTAEVAVVYGHPEEKPVRILKIKADITLHLPLEDSGSLTAWGADIISENDQPFDAP